ncbi:hypothetical protein L195_g044233 [Trifolium pratense]|uniref:Uncharacterized protein n=1 Tax=Trifolium pratense TaxID=57577 RepID=A0A2K3MBH8_TRIPR|nr:hypothetical protein L195_g044233 [Trifolium pratense]
MDGDKVVPPAPQGLRPRIVYQNIVYVRIFLRMWRDELRIDSCKFFCSVEPWHWVNIWGVPLMGRAPKQIDSDCLIDQVSSKRTTSVAHGETCNIVFFPSRLTNLKFHRELGVLYGKWYMGDLVPTKFAVVGK